MYYCTSCGAEISIINEEGPKRYFKCSYCKNIYIGTILDPTDDETVAVLIYASMEIKYFVSVKRGE